MFAKWIERVPADIIRLAGLWTPHFPHGARQPDATGQRAVQMHIIRLKGGQAFTHTHH